MNKKGFTLIEVITSIVLVSVILTFMLASLVKLREAYSKVNENIDAFVYSASITRILNNDFKDNGGIRSVECNEEGNLCDIVLNNDKRRKIVIYDNELSKIQKNSKENFADENLLSVPETYWMPCDIELKTNSGKYYCPVKTIATTLEYLDTTTSQNKIIYIKTLKLVKEQDLAKGINNSTGYVFGKISYTFNAFNSNGGSKNNKISKINIQINDTLDFNDSTYNVELYSSSVKNTNVAENTQLNEKLELYNIVSKSDYVQKYTGANNDTYGATGNKDIYYFTSNEGNNVIFADHCWQMIRTTSSGGVRLLYNGKKAPDNTCGDRGSNNLGYSSEYALNNSNVNINTGSAYYYADDYNYSDGTFSLTGTKTLLTWNSATASQLEGEYTCKSSNENVTCTTLYLISKYESSTAGKAIRINSSSHYSQFGTLQLNGSRYSPAYVGYKYGTVYPYKTIEESNVTGGFAASVAYSNGTYTLTGTTSGTATDNTHYFCSSLENGNCKKVGYVYYKNGTTLYYLELNGEASIEVALTNMLDNNTNDSTMKIGLEAWYKKYIEGTNNDKFIEQDSVYCNRREIKTLNGFNPNGGSLASYLYFKDNDSNSDLSCADTKDRFSKNNPAATLNYPIGLMTLPEANIIGSTVRNSGNNYWLGSAYYFAYNVAFERVVSSSGSLGYNSVNVALGARSVVSIRAGVKVESGGDGTVGNPYKIVGL